MQNVLVVGNVTKDIYLRLDNRQNHFEIDQNNVKWLDLSFDGSACHYYSRTSIYGGASISLEVLTRFGLNAAIAGTPATFLDEQFVAKDIDTSYRYILCQDDNVAYIAPSEYKTTTWQIPDTAPSWLFIDRSASLTPILARQIYDYLTAHPEVKLALFISAHSDRHSSYFRQLATRATLTISDTKLDYPVTGKHATIDARYINYENQRIAWSLKNHENLVTHLSSHLTIAASLLGATLLNKSVSDALLLARTNIENSRLGATVKLSRLETEILDKDYLIENCQKPDQRLRDLADIARRLVAPGKGILAADESGGSIHKKFESMQIPDDEQHRRDYRNLFFTTPNLEQYISGVILFEETAHQHADNGDTFIKFLNDKGIIVGIKVDQGLAPLKESSPETITKGLDGLSKRLSKYYALGARFAKWRAAFIVDTNLTPVAPSEEAIRANTDLLAQYAKACQDANLVPIVEPELVFDGDYSLDQSIDYTGRILDALFSALTQHDVDPKACILKCNMVLAGKRYRAPSTTDEIGHATAAVLRKHLPSELAGVVFLSGGQSAKQATANLRAIINHGPFPWPVTFSFARALQEPALQAWRGDNTNSDAARSAFRARLLANAAALKTPS